MELELSNLDYKTLKTDGKGFIIYDDGNILNTNTNNLLKGTINNSGYKVVTIGKNKYLLHRLLALAFIKNPNPKKYNLINHKDENKLNNDINNLEWCDSSYNQRYSRSKEIYAYDKNGNEIHYNCIADCEKDGYSAGNIINCCKNKINTAYGMIWSYYKLDKNNVIEFFNNNKTYNKSGKYIGRSKKYKDNYKAYKKRINGKKFIIDNVIFSF